MKYGPYSPSRLDTALCGYSFYKQYIDPERKNLPKVENVAAARGSVVHLVFEKITKKFTEALANNSRPDLNFGMIKQWVADAINMHPAAYSEIEDILAMANKYAFNPPPVLTSDAEIELRLAIKPELNPDGTWKTWVDQDGDLEFTRPCFVECDYEDPQAFARGRADIMYMSDDLTTISFYDHKTQPNIEAADTHQMAFYAWVISCIRPDVEQISTTLHFARYGKYSEPKTWAKRELRQVEDIVMTEISVVEGRTAWDATPNKNCQYCPFLDQCPVMKRYVHVDEVTGRVMANAAGLKILAGEPAEAIRKAVEVAGVITVMEEILKLAKAELRQHVTATGAGVAIPGRIYEYRTDEAINWVKVNKDRMPVYKVFEKHKIDPRDWMGFSQTFTSGVWVLDQPELVRELSEILPRKTSTEFGGFKS